MNLKPYSRGILTVFGLLDAVLIGLYFGKVVTADLWPSGLPIGASALELLKGIFLVSLIFSAIGLCLEKRWALLLGYVQFPFRLIIPMLTFGFLPHIPLLSRTFGGSTLLIAAVILEIVRLVVSILLQRGGGKR